MIEDKLIQNNIEYIKELKGFRVVEDQQFITTRPLVDSDEEHSILEDMLERTKPPLPEDELSDASRSDYLLFTPFRYPPLLEGTRFGRIDERSPFYGSLSLEGCFSEIAHNRFRFIDDSKAKLSSIAVDYTSFNFVVSSRKFIDLSSDIFLTYKDKLTNKADYSFTQNLGKKLRNNNVQMCKYWGARKDGVINIVIFTPSIFTKRTFNKKTWKCITNDNVVEFYRNRELKYKFIK